MSRSSAFISSKVRRRFARTAAWQAIVYPRLAFLRNYILRGGFRDGHAGLLVSKLNSYYVFLKYVKLFEMQRLARAAASEAQPPAR